MEEKRVIMWLIEHTDSLLESKIHQTYLEYALDICSPNFNFMAQMHTLSNKKLLICKILTIKIKPSLRKELLPKILKLDNFGKHISPYYYRRYQFRLETNKCTHPLRDPFLLTSK
mmetsp:Transcript_574/g.498  ORF Transcript_574/g.498 Transcript_574/m.498 type:complete len:115 (+) Transcript_574:246-590(+)